MPMGVVMLFGRSETNSLWPRENTFAKTTIAAAFMSTPTPMPASTAGRLLFKTASWRYSGMARHTVAGVTRKLMWRAEA